MYRGPPVSSVRGIPGEEYWNGLPFPSLGDLPDPGIELGSPALQADSLPTELPGKAACFTFKSIIHFDFIFMWYMRFGSGFNFCLEISSTIYQKVLSFLYLVAFCIFVKYKLSIFRWSVSGSLYSIPWIDPQVCPSTSTVKLISVLQYLFSVALWCLEFRLTDSSYCENQRENQRKHESFKYSTSHIVYS